MDVCGHVTGICEKTCKMRSKCTWDLAWKRNKFSSFFFFLSLWHSVGSTLMFCPLHTFFCLCTFHSGWNRKASSGPPGRALVLISGLTNEGHLCDLHPTLMRLHSILHPEAKEMLSYCVQIWNRPHLSTCLFLKAVERHQTRLDRPTSSWGTRNRQRKHNLH